MGVLCPLIKVLKVGVTMKQKMSQSNSGFTLVEICVVLVLFSVLITMTTMGLLSWQEYSTRTKQDENAELVYMAMKNKTAVLKKNKALKEFLPQNDTDNWMSCSTGDYEAYKSKTYDKHNVPEYKILFDMLVPYIYDKSILNACIAVEYNEDGDILAVLYCDRCDKFISSTGLSGETNVYIKSIINDSDARYRLLVGCYKPD